MDQKQLKIKAALLDKKLYIPDEYELVKEPFALKNNIIDLELGDWVYLVQDKILVETQPWNFSYFIKEKPFKYRDLVKCISKKE